MNELLIKEFHTPHQTFPFDQVAAEDYQPAIEHLLEVAKSAIEEIANSPEAPTVENTLLKSELIDKQLNRVVSAFFNLNSAETNDTIERAAQDIAPALASFSNDILLNEQLFKRVQTLYEQKDLLGIDAETIRILEKSYKGFVRNGALLNEEDKQKLRAIDQEKAQLKVQFQQNVLQETNAYSLHLTAEEDVKGLPESIKKQAAALAQKQELEGYLFNLQFPSYVPFMKYASNRNRRKELALAYGQRGFKDNEFNNEKTIQRLVELKDSRAQLLGYKNHAHFVLEERMAKSAENVVDFLTELLDKAKPFALKEIDELQQKAKEDGIDQMQGYDHAYYAEKLREERFDYSEESVKPYFPLDNVVNAVFQLSERLFGLTFKEVTNIAKYHEEVKTYEVYEAGAFKAILYTDYHPRAGKRAGAWMTNYKGQYMDPNGTNERPHISIVCNFSRPTKDSPSLLTFQEVTTLFHEMGHALHGILANTKYETTSGTNVYWDFVELPSQFLENYCYEKEFLLSFAKHWETESPLPEAIIDKIIRSANFMEGYQTLRQLSFGLLDIAYHTSQLKDGESVQAFENRITKPTKLYPSNPSTCFSVAFSHIFGGGYDSGYYSYKWAEVLDADAFAYFQERGIFDAEVANKFKQLLSLGGSKDPMDLYLAFRGQKPTVDALIKRAGLVKT